MHLADHSHVGSITLGLIAVGMTNGYQPLSNPEHAWWGFCFLTGNLLPDVTNAYYAYIAWQRKKNVNLLRPESWSKLFFKAVDLKLWGSPYKAAHSLVLYVPLLYLSDNNYVDALLWGCILHALIDAPTHERCWLFWPIWHPNIGTDWWESWPFSTAWWQKLPWISMPAIAIWQGYCLW